MARFSALLPAMLLSVILFELLYFAAPASFNGASSVFPFPLNTGAAVASFLGILVGVGIGILLMPAQATRIAHHARAKVSAPGPRVVRPTSILAGPKVEGWRPLPPMIKYFGGKSRLAPKIVARIPEHDTWVEPFAGGASVTLAKPPSKKEVLSDKRADLTRFFRYMKTGHKLKIPPDSKAVFKRIRAKPEAQRTPGELVRLQGSSFGGHGLSYASSPSAATGTLLNKRIELYKHRLQNTTILTQDFAKTIRRFDSPKTAVYIDPPYPEEKQTYTHYGGRRIPSAQEVKAAVQNIDSKVMISYPDIPSVRAAFKPPHWRTERFTVLNAMYGTTGRPKTRTELLITNYNPRRDHWKPETELG